MNMSFDLNFALAELKGAKTLPLWNYHKILKKKKSDLFFNRIRT